MDDDRPNDDYDGIGPTSPNPETLEPPEHNMPEASDCVCTDEHTCSMHYFRQIDQARAGNVPAAGDCRMCGPFGRCGYHGGEIAETVSATPAAHDHPMRVHAVTGEPHDCDAESCHGVSDTNGPCGGCCRCLGGCVYWGPDPEPTRDRREVLAEMTRDAEPYADRVDVFGPPRTEPPSPAEAHEIMQRVTGQPQYPTPAELMQQARDNLANAQLPVMPPVTRPLDFAIVEAEARKLTSILPKAEFDSVIADAIAGHMAVEERRLTAAIPAGLPPGDTVVFELRHVGEVGLTVQVLTERKVFDGWPELIEQVGQAMKRLTADVAAAILAVKAMTDPATGERITDDQKGSTP